MGFDITPLINAGIKPQKFDWKDLGVNSKGLGIQVKPKYYQWLEDDFIMKLHFKVKRFFSDGSLDQEYIIISEANNNNFVNYTGDLVNPLTYSQDIYTTITQEQQDSGLQSVLLHSSGDLILDDNGNKTYPPFSIGEYDYITTIATQSVHIPDIINGYIPILFGRGKFDKPQN